MIIRLIYFELTHRQWDGVIFALPSVLVFLLSHERRKLCSQRILLDIPHIDHGHFSLSDFRLF